MSRCNRFEQEGLLTLQQGVQLDEHFSTCQDCIDAQQKYESLEKLIFSADSTSAPKPGWQDRVLESVNTPSPGRERFWPKSLAAGFAAVMFSGLLINQYVGQSPSQERLEIMLVSSDRTYRGAEAKKDDIMQINAHLQQLENHHIRVYLGDRLIESCGAVTACQRSGTVANLRVNLASLGAYQTVLIETDKDIKFSAGRLGQDVLLAHDQGANVSLGELVNVR